MGRFVSRLLFVAIALCLAGCCSSKKQKALLGKIRTLDQKNSAADLAGWQYQILPSQELDFVHRVHHFPAARPGAPLLVLVHGLIFDGRCFQNLKGLAADFELVAYNLPEESKFYHSSFDDYIPLLNDYFMLRGIAAVSLVGVSYGGGVVLRYAASPQRKVKVEKLVFISTHIFGSTEKQRKQSALAATLAKKISDGRLLCVIDKMMGGSADLKGSTRTPPLAGITELKAPAWYRQVIYSTDGYNAAADAKLITSPALVIHGQNDGTISCAESRQQFSQHLPAARFVEIPGGKHSMIYENGEQLADIIQQFVKK